MDVTMLCTVIYRYIESFLNKVALVSVDFCYSIVNFAQLSIDFLLIFDNKNVHFKPILGVSHAICKCRYLSSMLFHLPFMSFFYIKELLYRGFFVRSALTVSVFCDVL